MNNSASQYPEDFEPRQEANDQPGALPEWENVAARALDAVKDRVEPRLREMSERLYEDVLDTVQDYLLDNVLYNVRQQIASADRQALLDRQRVSYLFMLLARVTGALHDTATAAGNPDDRIAALLAESRAVTSWGDPGPGYGS